MQEYLFVFEYIGVKVFEEIRADSDEMARVKRDKIMQRYQRTTLSGMKYSAAINPKLCRIVDVVN